MNCSECGKKLGLFGRVQIGSEYVCRDCYEKIKAEHNGWGRGIPKYGDADLMSSGEIMELAINHVRENVLGVMGFEVQEECIAFAKSRGLICERDGKKAIAAVRVVDKEDLDRPLPFEERRELLQKAKDSTAHYCYYVNVSVNSADPMRASRTLRLKNDDFVYSSAPIEEVSEKVTRKWIKEMRKQIAELDPNRRRPKSGGSSSGGSSSGESSSFNKFSKERKPNWGQTNSELLIGDPRIDRDYSRFNSAPLPMTFQEKLLDLIEEKGMSYPDFYNAAMIDRKLFSAIKNNRQYRPKKETVVACCFGLDLDLKEAQELLWAAGYSLSLAIVWDRVVYFCLLSEITDLDIVNDLLYAEGQKCIGVVA